MVGIPCVYWFEDAIARYGSFADRLKYEHRQFHYDFLTIDIFSLNFVAFMSEMLDNSLETGKVRCITTRNILHNCGALELKIPMIVEVSVI